MTRLGGQPEGDNALEFRLLGSLEVVIDGASVDVGGAQPRTVLAMLLVAEGRVVPAESIIDALWGDSPPDSAAGTLQSYVSRLRRALVPGGARGEAAKLLAWDPPGYRLAAPQGSLDTRRFESLAERGRAALDEGDPATARALLDEALGLWRGAALLEFSHLDFAWGFAAKLEERRLVATEDRIEADLRLGRHASVVGELGELVAANPLREPLRHHLALALYRSGRQAEALRILDDARRTLRDQLGIDPGRPLVELEAAILAQAPELTIEAVAPPRDPAAAAPRRTRGARGAAGVATGASTQVSAPGGELVGREFELRLAVAALDEAGAAARVVLVEGEPGIGKTRLLEELTAEARRRGVVVHWGHAFEGGATPAFWPWLPIVRSLVAQGSAAGDAPELRALLDRADVAEAGLGDRTRFQVLEAVVELLADAAAEGPLAIVLDDLQWADLPSLELLTFVARELGERPVLLAATVRELEVGRNDAVVETLASLSRLPATRRIELRGLSHLHTASLANTAAGRELEPDTIAAIQDRADGNPFFATELANLVEAERDPGRSLGAVSVGGDVPSSVRDVVRRRLALLPEPTMRLLEVAAVVGREVELDLLVRAADVDVDVLLDDLDPAIVHRLLAPVEDRPGVFRFSHALVREVVTDDVSSLRRARIHLRVADALEATAGHSDDAAEIRAEHLWAAAPIGVGRRAAAALERAAEVAVQRYAFESAESMLDRAVGLRRSIGGADDVEAELLSVSRLLSIQRSRRGYAGVTESPHLRRAQDLAQRTGHLDVLARLLWTEWAAFESRGDFAGAEVLARRLSELAGRSDSPLVHVTGLASLGIVRWHQGQLSEACELLDDAVRVGSAGAPVQTIGLDLEVLLLPHPFSRYLHVLVGDAGSEAEAEAGLEELADAAPDRFGVVMVEMLAAAAAIATGRPEWAMRAARRGLAADPEMTFAFWGRGLQGYQAAALIELGQPADGLARLDEAIDGFLRAGGRTGMAVYLASRVMGLTALDRLDDAEAALVSVETELRTVGERFAEPLAIEARARLALARGEDPATVADLFGRAIALASEQGGHGVATRVRAVASGLGVDLPD